MFNKRLANLYDGNRKHFLMKLNILATSTSWNMNFSSSTFFPLSLFFFLCRTNYLSIHFSFIYHHRKEGRRKGKTFLSFFYGTFFFFWYIFFFFLSFFFKHTTSTRKKKNIYSQDEREEKKSFFFSSTIRFFSLFSIRHP